MTTPFDASALSFDNTAKIQCNTGDPLMDFIRHEFHNSYHDYVKHAVSKQFVDDLVNNNLIDSKTGKAILPVVEFVYDKLDPCHL